MPLHSSLLMLDMMSGWETTGGLIVQVAQAAAASYQLPVRLDTSVMEEHAALFNNTVTLRK